VIAFRKKILIKILDGTLVGMVVTVMEKEVIGEQMEEEEVTKDKRKKKMRKLLGLQVDGEIHIKALEKKLCFLYLCLLKRNKRF
jgi:hypothetical protein